MSESTEQQQQSPKNTDLTFWSERWLANKIGFHRLTVNEHFEASILSKIRSIEQQQCVLFPLCGKTVDMKAVLDAGHRVIGIECVQLGIQAFFAENNINHEIENDGNIQIYTGIEQPITIFCADFFTFNKSIPIVDWIWDRGGLVAINVSDRERYRDSLLRLMTPGHTRLYLLALYYDDPNFTGPPCSLSDEHIAHLFGSTCSIEFVEASDTTTEFNLNNKQNLRLIEERLHLIVRK